MRSALDEHKELGLLSDHVFDLAEGLELLLGEPLPIELVLHLAGLGQLLGRRILYQLWLLPVRVKRRQSWHRIYIKLIDYLAGFVRIALNRHILSY